MEVVSDMRPTKPILITALFVLLAFSITIQFVKAETIEPLSFSPKNIHVVPQSFNEDTPSSSAIVTTSPALLKIYSVSNEHSPIKNVWLLLVLNEDTFNNLLNITANDDQGNQTIFSTADFTSAPNKGFIPLTKTNPPYPGSSIQYAIGGIRGNMYQPDGTLYYATKYFLPKINRTPWNFTLTVYLKGKADMKVLVLGLGRYDKPLCPDFDILCCQPKPFNEGTPFSHSTFVVPEPATFALLLAPFAALVIYRKRKQ
jgi:hypothetical protein